jgi:hypothetical protein
MQSRTTDSEPLPYSTHWTNEGFVVLCGRCITLVLWESSDRVFRALKLRIWIRFRLSVTESPSAVRKIPFQSVLVQTLWLYTYNACSSCRIDIIYKSHTRESNRDFIMLSKVVQHKNKLLVHAIKYKSLVEIYKTRQPLLGSIPRTGVPEIRS